MAAQEHKGQREPSEMREGQTPHEGSQARSQKLWVLQQAECRVGCPPSNLFILW